MDELTPIKIVCTTLVVLESWLCTKTAVEFCKNAWPNSKPAAAAWGFCAALNLAWIGVMVVM